MKQRNRIISLILGMILMICTGIWLPQGQAEAEDVTVYLSVTSLEIKKGENVTVTIHASGDSLASMTINLTYPAAILQYTGGSGNINGGNGTLKATFSGAGSISATFKAVGEGSARVVTGGGSAYDKEQSTLTVANAGVTIEVKPGTGVTTEKASDGVSMEKASDGASTEEASTEEPGELPDGIVKVENPEEVPAGYTETTAEYKNREVPAFESPNKVVKIIARADTDGTVKWYQLKPTTGELIPYVEYSASAERYVMLDKPSSIRIPEGFVEDRLNLGFGDVTVYRSEKLQDVVLIYCVSVQGVEGFHYYDTIDGSFFRFIQLTEKEPKEDTKVEASTEPATVVLQEPAERRTKEDEGIFTRDNLIKMLIGAVALFLIMAILSIVLMVKNAKLQGVSQEEYPDEDSPIRSIRRNGEEISGPGTADEGTYEAAEAGEKETAGDKNTEDGTNDISGEQDTEGKKSSEVTGETIEIILEAAEDNNRSVNVPPAEDHGKKTLEEVMKSRPYGIDSAFDVVESEQVDKTEDVHVKSEEPQRIALPDGEEKEEDAE